MQIVRFTALGNSLHSFDRLPDGVSYENISLRAEDGGESQGVLYRRGGEKAVACFMHPRGDQSRHWAMPTLLESGMAVWGQAGRWMMNDSEFIYEVILADIAASVRMLRARGFEKIIVVGNSGGGTLYAFYQSQACTPPPDRLKDTAAGDPFDLNALQMPPVDGMVHVATHLGQGKLMVDNIDPSVTDERDPLSVDPDLDMYAADNGYRSPPASSRYSEEFLLRYRAAQRARVRRIDATAWRMIEESRSYHGAMSEPGFEALPFKERQFVERRAFQGRYMRVHRTQANPALLDLRLQPNKREIGSFYSERPDICNYLAAGFGKWHTPRSWLSTWSVFASRASTLACLPRIDVPTLVIAFTGDNLILPGELEALYEGCVARDRTLHHVDGDHFGNPLPGLAGSNGRLAASGLIAEWCRERFS